MTKASAQVNEAQPYPSDALNIGTILDGYRIQLILGRGTFGITYLAAEEHLDRLVAIKEYLPIDFAVRDEDSSVHPRTGSHGAFFQYGLASFLKEAKTLVKFKHHNIVRVLTYFEQHKTAYIVVEYEIGKDLNKFIKKHPNLSESELLAIFTPINEGLDVVHQHGFIHRDIKPDNIYIRQDQSPVLLDFGAARDVVKTKADQLTRILTVGYAPYEQDNPAWADQGPWTDIYALGATLYVAVMGHKPIYATERAAAFMLKRADPYISALKAIDNQYSPPFLAAIDKALEFYPKNRPQSLSEWNELLTAGNNNATIIIPSPVTDKTVATNKTVNQDTKTTADKIRKKHGWDRPHVLFIAAVTVVLLSLSFGYYYWKSSTPRKNPHAIDDQTNISIDLVSSSFILAKTACWHYARLNKIDGLINKINELPSTLDRTRFITDQTKKRNEAENGFERNFSQYSISIIKLRRYPVDTINQAIQYFLQLPDYRNDQSYNLIAEVMTDHATKGTLSTEEWKSELIDITIKSGVFE